jgi:hypothetical protein
MNRVVVPLSGAIKFPFSFKMMAIGIVIHIFCVGLPIAMREKLAQFVFDLLRLSLVFQKNEQDSISGGGDR